MVFIVASVLFSIAGLILVFFLALAVISCSPDLSLILSPQLGLNLNLGRSLGLSPSLSPTPGFSLNLCMYICVGSPYVPESEPGFGPATMQHLKVFWFLCLRCMSW